MVVYLLIARRLGRVRVALAHVPLARHALAAADRHGDHAAFLYVPLLVIALYAFNTRARSRGRSRASRSTGSSKALHNPGVRDALWTSVKAGLGATAIALVLGTLAALAVARYRFFGRETISFLVILPIALPGIVTGMALNATFTQVLKRRPGAVHGDRRPRHVLHRAWSSTTSSRGCGARRRASRRRRPTSAPHWRTFRYVTFPQLRSALVAGALLAFAL